MSDPLATSDRPGFTGHAPWMQATRLFWLSVLMVGCVEVVGHFVITSRVPTDGDWAAAGAYVLESELPGDIIVAAPGWTGPLVRRELGRAMTLAEAGPSDFAPFSRVTELSIRGRREPTLAAARVRAASHRRFGAVTVRRYDLGPSPVRYDLTSNIGSARVTWESPTGPARSCPPVRGASGRGGGLGSGAMMPSERAHCDPARPWMWVGETVLEDLSLRPRHCVWQHPPGGAEVIAATFDDVALGGELVLYAGLYSEHERMAEHGPFSVRVLVDGGEVGTLVHRDGDGWKRMVAATLPAGADPATRGSVRVEVQADDPHLRAACWAATLRAPMSAADGRVLLPPMTDPLATPHRPVGVP